MTITKILELLKQGEKVIVWVKENENSNYALLEDITYPPMDCSRWFEPFRYRDDILEIIPVDDTHIIVNIFAFDGKDRVWNGPSIVGNIDEGLMLASLPHDVLYDRMDVIEKCTGVKAEKIRAFADVVLANCMEKYGSGKFKARTAYTAVKCLGGIYHWIKGMVSMIILAYLAANLAGCSYPMIIEDELSRPSYMKLVETNTSPIVDVQDIETATVPVPDERLYDLVFCYGGFDGSKAKEADAKISDLKISKDGLSYKWVSGGCEALGAESKTDASRTLACVFYFDGKSWRGGKCDWISTSRTSRDFKNIKEGYRGWNYDEFIKAKKHAFAIYSSNGKSRTNIIED